VKEKRNRFSAEGFACKLIYLHGFNSASTDDKGDLLPEKTKLQLLSEMCADCGFIFKAPNLDYQDLPGVVEQLIDLTEELDVHRSFNDLSFIGTSLGGFMAEVMARKTATNAIMINPAIKPSESLQRSIGPLENYVTGEKYIWTMSSSSRIFSGQSGNPRDAHDSLNSSGIFSGTFSSSITERNRVQSLATFTG